MLIYAVLHLTGYSRFGTESLKSFRKRGSLAAGHPEAEQAHGIEATTGPPGQGIANAAGMALAERILATRFGEIQVDRNAYVVCGGGCLTEGVSREAASIAGRSGLSRLITPYEDNGIAIDGPASLSFSDNATLRFEAYG